MLIVHSMDTAYILLKQEPFCSDQQSDCGKLLENISSMNELFNRKPKSYEPSQLIKMITIAYQMVILNDSINLETYFYFLRKEYKAIITSPLHTDISQLTIIMI